MSRIKITCSEEDKERILDNMIDEFCPFSTYIEGCCETLHCTECLADSNNIEFEIKED